MNKKFKHILFLPRWYPHLFDPMFGLFVKKHAEAVSLYNKVSILYVQGISNQGIFEKKQIIKEKNINTLIYYYRNSNFKAWNILRYWYYLIVGFFLIKKENGSPNLIHVHILTRLGIFALFLKTIYNIPYIITEHWSRYLPIPGTYKGWLRKLLGRIVVKNAKAILPVSKNLAEAMQKHGLSNENYRIVPNVVDDIFFQELPKKEKVLQTIFLHVSTFEDRSKNISGILRALKRLSEKSRDFELWLVGEGMDFATLKEYANELNIPKEQIQFFGLKQGEELVDIYHKSDYLLLFSNFENIPVVINEAQACGLPVIATKVGGIQEVVNIQNGFLIDVGNEKQLEALMDTLIKQKPRFQNSKIQEMAKTKFSYKAVGKKISNIYLEHIPR